MGCHEQCMENIIVCWSTVITRVSPGQVVVSLVSHASAPSNRHPIPRTTIPPPILVVCICCLIQPNIRTNIACAVSRAGDSVPTHNCRSCGGWTAVVVANRAGLPLSPSLCTAVHWTRGGGAAHRHRPPTFPQGRDKGHRGGRRHVGPVPRCTGHVCPHVHLLRLYLFHSQAVLCHQGTWVGRTTAAMQCTEILNLCMLPTAHHWFGIRTCQIKHEPTHSHWHMAACSLYRKAWVRIWDWGNTNSD